MLYQSVLLSRICRLMRCLLNDKIKQREVVALHERLIEATGGSNGIRDLASGKIVTKDMLKWIISHEK